MKKGINAHYFLDVNVLLALAWGGHQFHKLAHQWFKKHYKMGWATSSITQLAFIRVSANPNFTEGYLDISASMNILQEIVNYPGHVFIDYLPSPLNSQIINFDKVLGHKQFTDVYLVDIAKFYELKFVTFDQRLLYVVDKDSLVMLG